MHDKLRALIDQLRLHGMADALDAELARAEREAIAAPDLLYRLLGQEAASRRQPGVSQAQIRTLAGLDFLRRADNVLLIGKPGTGKTGLGSGCCVRPASTATAVVSTVLKSCSTNFTPRWRIALPPDC